MISVIVATYNRADALDACLRGFSRQSDRDFEVVVADDGSRSDTAHLVASWQGRIGVPLKHVWHEDTGFRLAEIRNRAILASQGANCVFIDGDCIPCRDYVAAHRALSEPGWFVAGNRALLSQAFTEKVLREHLEPECWSLAQCFAAQRAATSTVFCHCCACRLGRCVNCSRPHGAVRAAAIWRSAAQTSIASMDSMPCLAAGAARIPTSCCG